MASAQADVDSAVAEIKTATETLTEAATLLSGLNIPAPIDTSALPAATAALTAAVGAMQTAVSAEQTKMTPTPPAT